MKKMIFETCKTVGVRDLEEAIQTQYDTYIDISQTFFGDSFTNDSYMALHFRKDWDEEITPDTDPEDMEEIVQRNLVRGYLRDVLPDDDFILVDLSW